MADHSRREFLRHTAALGGALALGPAGFAAAAPPPGGAQAAAAPLQMTIAKWKGPLDPTAAAIKAMATKVTEQAIAALGGMGRFVKKGDVVWVKPNIGWDRTPEQAANTNPDVVATLVRLCFEAGAKKVKVGDLTCNPAPKTYANSGIEAAAKAAQAEVVYLDESRFKEVALNGKRLDKWALYPEIIESDLVINVPVIKNHTISNLTGCMKNYMGVVGGKRDNWHQDLETCLCDITAYMKPRLCVIDAVRVLLHHGPTGGDLADVKQLNTVAAGTDIVALDALGCELLGIKPEENKTVKAGQAAGLGKMDYRSLALKEIEVA